MEAHHEAWLAFHTDRTAQWLADRLADGFDVHHLDGDHANNDPMNLVLIEAADHMRLHGLIAPVVRRVIGKGGGRPKGSLSPHTEGCYRLRAQGQDWEQIAAQFGLTPRSAMQAAKRYAQAQLLKWPIKPSKGESKPVFVPAPKTREQLRSEADEWALRWIGRT